MAARHGLAPAAAARFILEHVVPGDLVRVPLRDALDLVLAELVTSPLDLPPWDNSAMDGFAVRAADLSGASAARPAVLDVVETVQAGAVPGRAIGTRQATRLFTGAPVPDGADCVVRQEDTTPMGDNRVAVVTEGAPGLNLRRRGEDVRRGETVFRPGDAVGPAACGVLASIAQAEPLVHRRPRVAFLAVGDEIAGLERGAEIVAGRKIASANSYTLDASIRRAGAEPADLGIARDTTASLREALARRGNADLLVTTGGVSVGEYDLVRPVLAEMGCDIKLWRVTMRPGAPLGFGMLEGKPWLGLPGNPVSTMVTFELFVRPVIRRLMGHPRPFRRTVRVRVGEAVALAPGLRHYLRASVLTDGTGALTARLTGPQGSGILTSMARADALVIVPEDRPAVVPGAELDALLLDDPVHVAEPPF